MRHVAALALCLSYSPTATAEDVGVERQRTLDETLTTSPHNVVTALRNACASGREPALIARDRAAGLTELPDATEYCVAALTRLGRDGLLGFVYGAGQSGTTPALSFDTGFVEAYLKKESVPDGLPTFSALKPVAERCLAQGEPDTELCLSVGYAYGLRAARGEVVRAG